VNGPHGQLIVPAFPANPRPGEGDVLRRLPLVALAVREHGGVQRRAQRRIGPQSIPGFQRVLAGLFSGIDQPKVVKPFCVLSHAGHLADRLKSVERQLRSPDVLPDSPSPCRQVDLRVSVQRRGVLVTRATDQTFALAV